MKFALLQFSGLYFIICLIAGVKVSASPENAFECTNEFYFEVSVGVRNKDGPAGARDFIKGLSGRVIPERPVSKFLYYSPARASTRLAYSKEGKLDVKSITAPDLQSQKVAEEMVKRWTMTTKHEYGDIACEVGFWYHPFLRFDSDYQISISAKCINEKNPTGAFPMLEPPVIFDWPREFCTDNFIGSAWVQVELDLKHKVRSVSLRAATNQTLGTLALETARKWHFKERTNIIDTSHQKATNDIECTAVIVFEFQALATSKR